MPVPPSASASASAIHVRVQSSCILIPLTLFNGALPTKVKAATQHKSSDPMSFTSLMGRTILRMLKVKWWKRERESDLLTARWIYTYIHHIWCSPAFADPWKLIFKWEKYSEDMSCRQNLPSYYTFWSCYQWMRRRAVGSRRGLKRSSRQGREVGAHQVVAARVWLMRSRSITIYNRCRIRHGKNTPVTKKETST